MHNGYSHPIDPGGTSYAPTSVPMAMTSIGSGVVAGTLAAVDALGGVPAAAPGLLLGGNLGIPAFMTPALLTGPSMDMAVFVFAFLSVGIASLNLAHGFWLKRRDLAAYAEEQAELAKKAHAEEHAHQKEHARLVERVRSLEEEACKREKTEGHEHHHDHDTKMGTGLVAVRT
ncbi:MAG TPA: hypothetical protein VF756_18840 [Thermoanaerobaculia bacterium]